MRPAPAPVLALALALALASPAARADEACPDAPPSDEEVRARLAFIERHVERDEDDVRRWYTGVVVFHTVLGGVNLTMAIATPDDQQRIDLTVNTISAFLGLLTVLVSTPPILGAGDALRALPRSTEAERLAALRAAEQRLRRSADASAFVRSELASLLSVAYVEAASLTLLFLGRPVAAILHASGGAILGQGRLLLHPSGSIDAWRAYRARHPDAGCDPLAAPPRYPGPVEVAVSPALGAGGIGLAVALAF